MNKSFYENVCDLKKENVISVMPFVPVIPSHFHYKNEIIYVAEGRVRSVINGKEYVAEKDDVLFVPEYYPHFYENSPDSKRIVLLPSNDAKTDYERSDGKTFPCFLNDKSFNRAQLLPVFEDFCQTETQLKKGEEEAGVLLRRAYIGLIYGKLLLNYGKDLTFKDKRTETLADVLSYIEKNYKNDLTLSDLANKFGYNKFYFSKFFNSATGESLTSYVNAVRVRKFLEKYDSSKKTNVLSLAFDSGFDSMPSFYRAFKKVYGVAPIAYFKQNGVSADFSK